MTHPLTPREKVARIVDPESFDHPTVHPQHLVARRAVSFSRADAILAALASGSGDHAELARLMRLTKRLRGIAFDYIGKADRTTCIETEAANALEFLLAENAALRAERRNIVSHATLGGTDGDGLSVNEISVRITAIRNDMHARATEAERKLAEAVATLKEIAAIEPEPFDGGLDMEAIRACEECRRYEGHPVQHGICNTHRRPIWDREKHESHEEKALGYRAKSIARTFLSKEAERG
ncbi:hypothetical protein [Brevundimonas olei]|uniref:hypothetical protein n=1 Tax=Brevundimonas olei TaxID=657642 RepID=UPI0031CFC097